MFEVIKKTQISAAHKLKLPYKSECTNMHGHNWIVTVCLKCEKLNASGMIEDFDIIKERLKEKLDHKNLNEVLDFNPTAENLAKYICDFFAPYCYRVEVEESADSTAVYYKQL